MPAKWPPGRRPWVVHFEVLMLRVDVGCVTTGVADSYVDEFESQQLPELLPRSGEGSKSAPAIELEA